MTSRSSANMACHGMPSSCDGKIHPGPYDMGNPIWEWWPRTRRFPRSVWPAWERTSSGHPFFPSRIQKDINCDYTIYISYPESARNCVFLGSWLTLSVAPRSKKHCCMRCTWDILTTYMINTRHGDVFTFMYLYVHTFDSAKGSTLYEPDTDGCIGEWWDMTRQP